MTVDRRLRGAVHRHRGGLAFESHGRKRLEIPPPPGRGKRGLIAEDVPFGGLHQAGGKIDHVADHRVLAAPAIADDAAKHPAARDAHRARPPERRKAGLDVHGCQDAAEFIVFVRQGRQAQRRDEGDAFVVRAQLVDAALVAVERGLQGLHHALRFGQRRLTSQLREVDEQHRQPAEFPQPICMPAFEPLVNRRRDVAQDLRLRRLIEFRNLLRLERRIGRQGLQPQLAAGEPPAQGGIGQKFQCIRSQNNVAAVGGVRGVRGFGDRTSGDHIFPSPEHPAHARRADFPGADADAERQLVPIFGFAVAQSALSRQPAASRRLHRIGEFSLGSRPDGEQRIAGKLDDVSTGRHHNFDEVAEIVIEGLRQFLHTGGAALTQPFTQAGEPGNIGEQHRPGEQVLPRSQLIAVAVGQLPEHFQREEPRKIISTGSCGHHAGPLHGRWEEESRPPAMPD